MSKLIDIKINELENKLATLDVIAETKAVSQQFSKVQSPVPKFMEELKTSFSRLQGCSITPDEYREIMDFLFDVDKSVLTPALYKNRG